MIATPYIFLIRPSYSYHHLQFSTPAQSNYMYKYLVFLGAATICVTPT